jgi:hypothetical protein
MLIRSEGDIVLACNLSKDLTQIIGKYLELRRKIADGVNGIRLYPNFDLVLQTPKEQGWISVKIVQTNTYYKWVPTYYDVDDDRFQEGFGANNESGGYNETFNDLKESFLSIPMRIAFMNEEQMIEYIKGEKSRYEKRIAEERRKNKIAQLKSELNQLESAPEGDKSCS